MGEEKKNTEGEKMEEKKPEEKKPEEPKKEAGEEKKETKKEEKQSNESEKVETKEEKITEKIEEFKEKSGEEIVLKVYMHCEGCARKVRRSLRGFEGVEEVVTDCKTNRVIVKGEKADPNKVLQRVQRKSHRQVELLSPVPKSPSPEKKVGENEKLKTEEKNEELQIITVVLRIHMHCEACAQEIKKRILRMKEVESAEPDLKNSEVTVIGGFDPEELVEYVYKRTGKQAVILKEEPEKKEEEKKSENGGDKEKKKKKKKKEDEKEGETEVKDEAAIEESNVVELKRNEYYYNYPQTYFQEMTYAYPPQMFSDENPNACSVM